MSCPSQRVRLTIEGVGEVPTVEQGLKTEITNSSQQGGAGVTRLTEAYIPLIEWRGTNYVDQISAFDPANQSNYSTAIVEVQSVRNPDEWTVVHRGFVRGVSGTNNTGTGGSTSGVGRVIISDPVELLSAIPFSKKYEEPTIEEVFNDVAQTFNENSVFDVSVNGAPDRTIGGTGAGDALGDLLGIFSFGFIGRVDGFKSFKKNRHNCAQVLNWATALSGHRWYFEPRDGGIVLVYDDGGSSVLFTQRENRGPAQDQQLADQGSFPQCGPTELDVIRNDALASIFPINSLSVKGHTGVSIHGNKVPFMEGKKAPYVTVEYPPFIEAAGGTSVSETIEVGATSLSSAENVARKKLEQKVTSSGTGEIECFGNGHPKPFDSVIAKPECSDIITTSDPELPYTISSVIHEKAATKEHGPLESRTTLKVAPAFNPDEIVVTESEMREV